MSIRISSIFLMSVLVLGLASYLSIPPNLNQDITNFQLPLGNFAFAQEEIEIELKEEIGVSDEEKVEEKVEEKAEEEDVMEEPEIMEEIVMSPLKQMKSGIAASEVKCKEGLELIFKATDGSAKCVSSSTASVLVQRGWATQ